MAKIYRVLGVLVLLLASSPAAVMAAPAAQLPGVCVDAVQPDGSIFRVCMPTGEWNGDLVLYAHGYVSVLEPIGIPEDQLEVDGTYIPFMINEMGYAFATASYPVNGLAVKEGVQDMLELLAYFEAAVADPEIVYLAGVSEGSLIATLAVEQHPEAFSGGFALCGPIGDFRRQVNYWGDFRVLYDYFFPGVLPPSPVNVPDEVQTNWESIYLPLILNAVAADPGALVQLLNVSRVPIDEGDPTSIENTVERILWYNVFATNDGVAKLGGQPYGNRWKFYFGSEDDRALNRGVERFQAEKPALNEINATYQTSGALEIPLVTMHTTGDPVVPYWHAVLYHVKALDTGSLTKHVHVPVARYGHCSFTTSEVLLGFSLLNVMVEGFPIPDAEDVLDLEAERLEYFELLEEYGVK